ncbi:MAG TPA: hypothetical protein VKH81_25150 [Candidatus Angelobacter sp.]|nr:hypothetical protein [Candidatus Angelobacter sp.]
MILPHILSVGLDQFLMRSRSGLLRQAGFVVDEAYNLNAALAVVACDLVDILVLCHTIPRNEQRWLISQVRNERWLIPIICIHMRDYELAENGCVRVSNDPVELLDAVRAAVPASLPGKPV